MVRFGVVGHEVLFDAAALDQLKMAGRVRSSPVEGADAGEWLGVAEAATVAGVSEEYLRRAARNYEGWLDAESEPSGPWIEARRAGRVWRFRREAVEKFALRRRPPAVRIGYDLTATTEKSFAVVAMLGGFEMQAVCLSAFTAANAAALSYMETFAAVARASGGRIPTTGLTTASFLHGTSRAQDPFPHHHNVVLNSVECIDGERRTLDGRALYRHAPGAAAVATARLRWELTRGLGVDWELSPRGVWEIAGISDEVIVEFSSRRREINDVLAELAERLGREVTPGEVDAAVLATRSDKAPTTSADLLAQWRDRAAQHGLDATALEAVCGRRVVTADRLDPDEVEELFGWLEGPNGVVAHRSCFDRVDVLTAMCEWQQLGADGRPQLRLVPPDQLDELADEFLASLRVLPLLVDSGRGRDVITRTDGTTVDATGGEQTYTTVSVIARQQRILAAAAERGGVQVEAETLEAVISARPSMSGDQASLVRELCTGTGRVRSAVGRPGSGKTWSMTAVRAAFEADGFEVFGAAVKSEAARLLGDETGTVSRTLAWHLERARHGNPLWGERSVLIVDEAATISDDELDRLLHYTRATGTTVCLVGDPAQHTSVAAGGTWALLARGAPSVSANRRQRDPVERMAIEEIRQGQIADGLGLLTDHGRVTAASDRTDAYQASLERWAAHDFDHPLVCQTNQDRKLLNRAAQALLQQRGRLPADGLGATDERCFVVGDQVIARENRPDLHVEGHPARHVTNGARGVVLEAFADPFSSAADRLVVDFDGIGPIVIERSGFDHQPDTDGRRRLVLDHAYAVTSYSVQGRTLPASTSLLSPSASRAEAYVDLTRGRDSNHLVIVGYPTDPEVHGAEEDHRTVGDQVQAGLYAHDHEPTPLELDPDAPVVARLRRIPPARLEEALASTSNHQQRAIVMRAIEAQRQHHGRSQQGSARLPGRDQQGESRSHVALSHHRQSSGRLGSR